MERGGGGGGGRVFFSALNSLLKSHLIFLLFPFQSSAPLSDYNGTFERTSTSFCGLLLS